MISRIAESKISTDQFENTVLKLKDVLYKATRLKSDRRKIYLLEDEKGNKFIAREVPIKTLGKDDEDISVKEALYYKKIFGLGERIFTPSHPNSYFVLCPYIPGKPLAETISKNILFINFSPAEFINVFLAAAEAVNTLHTNYKVIHGDLLASNMIFNNGKVTLIDFETMCEENEEMTILNDMFRKGTNRKATFSNDIYGLGISFITIYQSIRNNTSSTIEQAVLNKLNNFRLQMLLWKMTNLKSEDRPTLKEIIETLQAISKEEAKEESIPFKSKELILSGLKERTPPITCIFAQNANPEREEFQVQLHPYKVSDLRITIEHLFATCKKHCGNPDEELKTPSYGIFNTDYLSKSTKLGNIVRVDNQFKHYVHSYLSKDYKLYNVAKYHSLIDTIKFNRFEGNGHIDLYGSASYLITFKLKDKSKYHFVMKESNSDILKMMAHLKKFDMRMQESNPEIIKYIEFLNRELPENDVEVVHKKQFRSEIIPTHPSFWNKDWYSVQTNEYYYKIQIDPIILDNLEKYVFSSPSKELTIVDIAGGKGYLAELVIKLAKANGIKLNYILLEHNKKNCVAADEKLKQFQSANVKIINSTLEDFSKTSEFQKYKNITDCIISSDGPLNKEIVSLEDANANLQICRVLLKPKGTLLATGLSSVLLTKKDFEKLGFNVLATSKKIGDKIEQNYVCRNMTPKLEFAVQVRPISLFVLPNSKSSLHEQDLDDLYSPSDSSQSKQQQQESYVLNTTSFFGKNKVVFNLNFLHFEIDGSDGVLSIDLNGLEINNNKFYRCLVLKDAYNQWDAISKLKDAKKIVKYILQQVEHKENANSMGCRDEIIQIIKLVLGIDKKDALSGAFNFRT